MRRASALILLMIFLLTAGFVHAQEDEPPIVTATVIYPTVNVRNIPETLWSGLSEAMDSRIAQLSADEVVVVHLWENAPPNLGTPWVYATQVERGLTGWIRSDLLLFSSATWRDDVPAISTGRSELSDIVTALAPNGLQGYTYTNGGAPIAVYESPQSFAAQIAEFGDDEGVTILGRATANRRPLSLIYVRHNATGLEGWVYNRRIISFDKYEPVNSSLPVLYETNPIEETAGLPIFRIRDFNVRRGPSLDASILGYMSLSTRFAVTGRSIDGEWVTIVFLGSGAQGWISVTVLPESTLDIESLPVVE